MNHRRKKILSLAAALLIPQLLGGLGGLATASSVDTWYRRLRKPGWNPPAKVFGPVWTVLYLMMGAASWLVWRRGQENERQQPQSNQALVSYSLQLLLNLFWSLIFFGLRRVDLALAEIVVLWGFIFDTTRRFFRLNPIAGWLMLPYQLWTSFAAVLNTSVWWLNRERE